MKQLLQHVRTGESAVVEVPAPRLQSGSVLVQVAASLVSTGTERMVVDFAEKNLLQKARARPDLVRQVIAKLRREGVLSTITTVRSRLDQPMALGYSNAGTVVAVADDVRGLKIGDRVACAGGGYAVHGEFVCVPHNLVVCIPSAAVSFEAAAFTTVASIALQGVRLAELQLGATVAVIGLGLIGLITVQLAKASGCMVLGMDPNPARCQLAAELGCDQTASSDEQFAALVRGHSQGRGADAVIITAATSSDGPVNLAGEIARDRAIVVAVGAVGTHLRRKPYYEKELDFRISRSYGPGRYDASYEEGGNDYPVAYVRWTEGRNMEAVLQLLSQNSLDVERLITHRFDIARAHEAYELISGRGTQPCLGVIINYPARAEAASQHLELRPVSVTPAGVARVGVLGAGNFTRMTLLPAMKKAGHTDFVGVCAATGASARYVGDKGGFSYCTTDETKILEDSNVNVVVITTRHHLHEAQVRAALRAGKHVFCEKPLCLTTAGLAAVVRESAAAPAQMLMLGYNRRFAPLVQALKEFFAGVQEPLIMNCRINAGEIPRNHWTQDPAQGGGRIIGEACHWIDLCTFLSGSEPVRVFTQSAANAGRDGDDNAAIVLEFANGSVATITYAAGGDKSYGKERIEVCGAGRIAHLDDYRVLELVRDGRRKVHRSRLSPDRGHAREWQAVVAAIAGGGPAPIPRQDIIAGTLASLEAARSQRERQPIAINAAAFIAQALSESTLLED